MVIYLFSLNHVHPSLTISLKISLGIKRRRSHLFKSDNGTLHLNLKFETEVLDQKFRSKDRGNDTVTVNNSKGALQKIENSTTI